jgi:hypothetical protein
VCSGFPSDGVRPSYRQDRGRDSRGQDHRETAVDESDQYAGDQPGGLLHADGANSSACDVEVEASGSKRVKKENLTLLDFDKIVRPLSVGSRRDQPGGQAHAAICSDAGRSSTIPARSQGSAITGACARFRSTQRSRCSSAANIEPLARLHHVSARRSCDRGPPGIAPMGRNDLTSPASARSRWQ